VFRSRRGHQLYVGYCGIVVSIDLSITQLYLSGSRTLFVVGITAWLPWFNLYMLLGLPSDYGRSEELDCREAKRRQVSS